MVERFLNDADRNAEYVGDGAYVVDTGEGIRIFTSNGVEVTNEVWIDMGHLPDLRRFLDLHYPQR